MSTGVNDINDNKKQCDCLTHPFQHDPGISQPRRVMDELLPANTAIDGRKMADLLDYLYQLSQHVNFYDSNLNISDWRPFFEKSTPFVLASLVKYNCAELKTEFEKHATTFLEKPTAAGLQLLQQFIFYRVIKPMDKWYRQIRDTGLPAERVFDNIAKDKLKQPLLEFMTVNRLAAQYFNFQAISFTGLFGPEAVVTPSVAALNSQLKKAEEKMPELSGCEKLKSLFEQTGSVFSRLTDPIRILITAAEQSMEQSLLPLKEELQKKHLPQLGLLFAFLKLFQYLQADLNSYTKKHLDFFYKEVLRLKPREAAPDKVNLVFAIQKELKNYLLAKGLLVKDGKDINKEEILFSLDEEIVVNQAQVKEVRTLFVNNQVVPQKNVPAEDYETIIEGVYMAPDATKADGVDKDFQTEVKNYYTVGNKESKYILPGTNLFKPYPSARLGFILASPVLLLQEGKRTVTITLECIMDQDICKHLEERDFPASKKCCEDKQAVVGPAAVPKLKPLFRPSLSSLRLLKAVKLWPVKLIQPVRIPGIPAVSVLKNDNKPEADLQPDTPQVQQSADSLSFLNTAINQEYYYISEELIANAVKKGLSAEIAIKLREFLKISNETPKDMPKPYCYCPVVGNKFDTIITPENFEKTIDTANELVSEFFQKRKPLSVWFSGEKEWIAPTEGAGAATTFTVTPHSGTSFTLEIKATLQPDKAAVTFYNKDNLGEDFATDQPLVKIELDDHFKMTFPQEEVKPDCCLERVVAARDLMSSLYHVFKGVKVDAGTKIDVQVCGLRNFVVQNDESVADVNSPFFPFGSRPVVKDFNINIFPSPAHATPYEGPNFYIGSKEVFGKKWGEVKINLNWKDKPSDFFEYYNGYVVDKSTNKFGLDENKFLIKIAALQDGSWKEEPGFRQLFTSTVAPGTSKLNCVNGGAYSQELLIDSASIITGQEFVIEKEAVSKLTVNTRNGFIKISLRDQDFLHKDYAYVLARQMMAFGKLPKEAVEDAIYWDSVPPLPGSPMVFDSSQIKQDISDASIKAARVDNDVNNNPNGVNAKSGVFTNPINPPAADNIRNILRTPPAGPNLILDSKDVNTLLAGINGKIANISKFAAIIPNEPWTPTISGIALDYTASAGITDIDLIHLHPYAQTYKAEQISEQPTLFPTFCHEGNLFLGIEKLIPGSNLNILFQLAEATADSESEKEDVGWYYLDNNNWRPLRPGFEVLEDGTQNLTTSGIIRFALPENMTSDNTIMPKDLYWIKAGIPKNSRTVSETTGIHAQAMRATFTNSPVNDKLRLGKPLEAGQVAKLETADASVKQVLQPYESVGGYVPEEQGMYYVRVSELLRHKGRAIQKFDYERIVMDAFPEVFKAKCINHSFGLNAHLYKNDFPYAPGYIILAVIPDLARLKAGNSFEPKVPVSLIEKIESYISKRISPFVRFRAMNPRYERIHICLKVKLLKGKDENYYKEKLKEDIRLFLAPWAIGKDLDKLRFGQCVNRSDIIGFMESLDYIDFILSMEMRHESEPVYTTVTDTAGNRIAATSICPDTPRSVLIAGDIDVCTDADRCEEWSAARGEDCKNTATKLIICKTAEDKK